MGLLLAAMSAVVAMQVVLVAGLLRSHADILTATDDLLGRAGPPTTGLPVPDRALPITEITGTDRWGDTVVLSLVNGRGGVLLAFLSDTCLTCRAFADAFDAELLGLPVDIEVVVVTEQPADAGGATTTVHSPAAWQAFGAPPAPYFVLVDSRTGAVVGEGSASTAPHLRTLVDRWWGAPGTSDAVPARHAPRSTAERLEDVDEVLRAAGIGPGHPSLGPR